MTEREENEGIVRKLIENTFSSMPSITEEMGEKIKEELTNAYNEAKEFFQKKTESD